MYDTMMLCFEGLSFINFNYTISMFIRDNIVGLPLAGVPPQVSQFK